MSSTVASGFPSFRRTDSNLPGASPPDYVGEGGVRLASLCAFTAAQLTSGRSADGLPRWGSGLSFFLLVGDLLAPRCFV